MEEKEKGRGAERTVLDAGVAVRRVIAIPRDAITAAVASVIEP